MTRARADVDAGGGNRPASAVLVQYRMATTEQTHLITAPGVRIEVLAPQVCLRDQAVERRRARSRRTPLMP